MSGASQAAGAGPLLLFLSHSKKAGLVNQPESGSIGDVKLSRKSPAFWIGIAALIICLTGAATYLVLTKDARAEARMERQIGPLPEK